MKWIEKIEAKDGYLAPIYVDQAGAREAGSLQDAKSAFPRRGYRTAEFKNVSLQSFEVGDAREYLDAIGLSNVDASGHVVYALRHDGRTVLIPAVVMLQALVGRLNAVGDRLLSAASLDSVANPLVQPGGMLKVRFHRKAGLTQHRDLPSVQARFLWLTCFPSARRFWDSVFQNALQGELALTLPKALVDASLVGHRTADFVYVTRMSIPQLRPEEEPLPFASSLRGRSFAFQDQAVRTAKALDDYRKATPIKATVRGQDDIPSRRPGWKTTSAEWLRILNAMKQAGYNCPTRAKESVDFALEKLGGRQPWTAMGPRWANCISLYQRWSRSGQWSLLIQTLKELRQADMRQS